MRFTYEEAELLNGFISGITSDSSKQDIVSMIAGCQIENDDPELKAIVDTTIEKLNVLDDGTYKKIVSNLPVDTYTIY